MTVRKPFNLDSFKIFSYRMPLKLPDVVKHPILCRYCSIEIPIFQAALKVKPGNLISTLIRLIVCYGLYGAVVHSTQYSLDMRVQKVLSHYFRSFSFSQNSFPTFR